MRVKGHGLRYRGKVGMAGRLLPNSAGPGQGPGRGQCACGDLSPVLPNTNQRKRWHTFHQFAALAAADRASEEETA